ncbi:methyltransferase domain-containing protein [Scopulibacillus cellulosilyticus]|uniref:Methyltransferase domain-containing protein n=1 Tax=Scopulibacillus cellulosilyticus TaxID=2665665 RepID=A0ABW2PYD4_9BACL
MGHLNEKYNENYFLGGKDLLTNKDYGLSGFKDYKENKVHQRFADTFKFIESLIGHLKDKRVLEIGFGRGELIPFFLREKIDYYHGIDFSSDALKIAKKHYSDPKVKLEMKEAKDLSEKNIYDVIILNHVIEHIPVFEMEDIWKKLKNVLHPDGVIILSTPLYDNPNESDQLDEIHATMGMRCNKQTIDTILKMSDRHDLYCVKWEQNFFGFVKKRQHPLYSSHVRNQLSQHQKSCKAGRLLIGCVAENSAKYREQALRLVQSIRWFGGSMAGANIVVCMVEDADPSFVDELGEWGVFVRVVKRFSKEHAPSNKFRFFELSETAYYDTVILMDCDTIVVQDPLKYIDGKKFQAAMAGKATVSHDTFEKLFSHFNLPFPAKNFKASFKGKPMIWYCNAGVLIFPQKILPPFLSTWKKYVHDLIENKHLLDKFFFCEQAALTLAYFTEDIPFDELPKEMNYHLNPKILYKGTKAKPIIIHYHKYINKQGYLMENTRDAHLLKMIKKFNKRLRKYKMAKFKTEK